MFEALAGKATTRKWRRSIVVDDSTLTEIVTIGDWMKQHKITGPIAFPSGSADGAAQDCYTCDHLPKPAKPNVKAAQYHMPSKQLVRGAGPLGACGGVMDEQGQRQPLQPTTIHNQVAAISTPKKYPQASYAKEQVPPLFCGVPLPAELGGSSGSERHSGNSSMCTTELNAASALRALCHDSLVHGSPCSNVKYRDVVNTWREAGGGLQAINHSTRMPQGSNTNQHDYSAQITAIAPGRAVVWGTRNAVDRSRTMSSLPARAVQPGSMPHTQQHPVVLDLGSGKHAATYGLSDQRQSCDGCMSLQQHQVAQYGLQQGMQHMLEPPLYSAATMGASMVQDACQGKSDANLLLGDIPPLDVSMPKDQVFQHTAVDVGRRPYCNSYSVPVQPAPPGASYPLLPYWQIMSAYGSWHPSIGNHPAIVFASEGLSLPDTLPAVLIPCSFKPQAAGPQPPMFPVPDVSAPALLASRAPGLLPPTAGSQALSGVPTLAQSASNRPLLLGPMLQYASGALDMHPPVAGFMGLRQAAGQAMNHVTGTDEAPAAQLGLTQSTLR